MRYRVKEYEHSGPLVAASLYAPVYVIIGTPHCQLLDRVEGLTTFFDFRKWTMHC